MGDKVTVDRHLCLTEQGCCVVEETDSRARWLKWPAGAEVDRDEYERLTKCSCGKASSVVPETVELDFVTEPAVSKKRAPAANKSRTPQGNK
ncbi:hypothetical protein [Streptomyces sp. NPDC002855]|uniref:hypothetical protein n=1 Tax=Streptomyces sp. NPDC002855 TaxID=3154437 RepID=UPI003333886F